MVAAKRGKSQIDNATLEIATDVTQRTIVFIVDVGDRRGEYHFDFDLVAAAKLVDRLNSGISTLKDIAGRRRKKGGA
jgi:hypothetical protein